MNEEQEQRLTGLEDRIKYLEDKFKEVLEAVTKTGKSPPARAHAKNIEEVAEYVKSVGLNDMDAEYIWNLWESNGWTRNGRKILDWKATVRSWNAGRYFPSQRLNNRHGSNGQSQNGKRAIWQIEADITSVKNRRARLLGCYTIETLRQQKSDKCREYDVLSHKLETLRQELAGA